MREIGEMIKLMVKEFIYIEMVHHIQVDGRKIDSMGMELRNGLMVHNTKEIMSLE
jgi:hypothetical protein